ncbi:MAG TPA: tRNA-guanine transglycosylase DpdA [Polyangiaceae bacterium]|nr:tRNA-guanine transglycosylase DpdA [Polyangiaceae bacterium]
MKYFLPDSQDLVDPTFDFERERRSSTRMRQRDDEYAHELFRDRAYDGLLVSKGIVDGFTGSGGRYTLAQRHRLLRAGAPEFFRTERSVWGELPIMGDCGAFTYVREKEPPYSVDEVIAFYLDCQFTLGISVDHVILTFEPKWDGAGNASSAPDDVQERQRVTLDLARDFLHRHRRSKLPFEPLGVAQGWSPRSYARAVSGLQKMGYRYIAVGGMVPLKTPDILASLAGIADVRRTDTRLHLLGVTRTEQMSKFLDFGVTSFDSTSPLRQAFKDDKDNYYTLDRTFVAIRIPQVEGNPKFQKAISSGRVSQDQARRLERAALDAMRKFEARELSVSAVLEVLQRYEDLYDPGSSHTEAYRETLTERPWSKCSCDVCLALGHHVILFRGAERNRRRGLHNIWTFYRRIQRDLHLRIQNGTPSKRLNGRQAATIPRRKTEARVP